MSESQNSDSINLTKNLIEFINKSQEFIIESEHSLNSINESRFSESFYASGINILKIRLKSVKKIFSLQKLNLNDDVTFITLQLLEQEEIEPINSSNGRIFREINHMKKRNKFYNIKKVHLKLLVKENNIKFKKNKIVDLDNLFNKVEKAIKNPKTIKIVSQSLDLDHINYENESNIKIVPQKLNFAYEKTGEKNNNIKFKEDKIINESDNLFLKKIHHKKKNINNNDDININDEKIINGKKEYKDVNLNDEKLVNEKKDNNENNIINEKRNNKIDNELENNKKKLSLKDNTELKIDENKNLKDDKLEEKSKKIINLKDNSEFKIDKKVNLDDNQLLNLENDKKNIINVSEIKSKNDEKKLLVKKN